LENYIKSFQNLETITKELDFYKLARFFFAWNSEVDRKETSVEDSKSLSAIDIEAELGDFVSEFRMVKLTT